MITFKTAFQLHSEINQHCTAGGLYVSIDPSPPSLTSAASALISTPSLSCSFSTHLLNLASHQKTVVCSMYAFEEYELIFFKNCLHTRKIICLAGMLISEALDVTAGKQCIYNMYLSNTSGGTITLVQHEP